MYFTVLDECKTVRVFRSRKQLAAAADVLSRYGSTKHYSTPHGVKHIRETYDGYDVRVTRVDNGIMYVPNPAKPYLLHTIGL